MKPSVSKIIAGVREIIIPEPCNKQIFSSENVTGKNEFLLFIKPELLVNSPAIQLENIIELIFGKIEEYNLSVQNIRTINAAYLEKHNIIAQHYGVINKLSGNLRSTITNDGITKFEQIFADSFQKAEVLGSIEFLLKYPHFTPTGLSYLWQNCPTVKLAGGTYAQKLNIDGKTIYLINGFHPRQLEHFTASDRCIVTMTLIGDTDWSIARNRLIGKTNPTEAEKGSIRRELYDKKAEFGLSEVSSSWNGVHLSAGPIEGLAELIRYNSDFENDEILSIADYEFGRKLISKFGQNNAERILSNADIRYNDAVTTVFDATEEMNSDDCIRMLNEFVYI